MEALIAQGLLFAGPLGASVVSLMALHWFPWRRGAGWRALDRRTAYMLGTLVTVGMPLVAMLLAVVLGQPQGELFWMALLIANTGVSGATVHFCYWVDSGRALTRDEVAHGGD